jgi:CheY-like chemotaxis protein
MANGNRLARLLLVDNNPSYIDPLRDRLIDEGWEAEVAYSPEEALARVREERFHLCIVDKRLRDDHDPADRSGLELIPLLWRADGLLHFVLLTGWPELKEAIELMQGTFPTRERCCNAYVPKDDGIEPLIQEIEKVEREALTLDWNLPIRELLDLEEVLEPLLRETEPAVRAKRLQELSRDAELLLRWIFYDRRSPRFALLDAQGRSGARILHAQAGNGPGWVIKLATRLAAEEEWDNFKGYVEPVIGQRPEVRQGMCQVGSHLGAIAYSRVAQIDPEAKLHDLRSFLVAPETTAEDAGKALRQVVLSAQPWFDPVGRARATDLHDLTAYYTAHFQLASAEQAQRFRALNLAIEEVADTPVLAGEKIGGEVMNPLPFLARARFLIESDWNVCHGDLNASNVLIRSGVPWLIDFASTGPGPTCLDWVTLEASLKFDHPWPAAPDAWFRFEEALVLQESLEEPSSPPADLSPDLARLFAVVVTVRSEVAQQVRPHSGLLEYLVGLFYATVAQARFFWRKERNSKAYRVLASAGLIAERLAGMGTSRNDLGFVYSWRSSGLLDLAPFAPAHDQVLEALAEERPLKALLPEPSPAARLEILRIAQEKLVHSMLSETLGRRPPGVRKVDLDQCFNQLKSVKNAITSLWPPR